MRLNRTHDRMVSIPAIGQLVQRAQERLKIYNLKMQPSQLFECSSWRPMYSKTNCSKQWMHVNRDYGGVSRTLYLFLGCEVQV
jgi:hypothetical protein